MEVSDWIMIAVVNAIAFYVGALLLPGVKLKGIIAALLVGAVITFFNSLVHLLFGWLDLGIYLLHLVIDAIVILIADRFLSGIRVRGFFWAFLLAFVVSLVNGLLGFLT